MQSFYFWFSLSFLMCRTLTVCWSASLVYEESKSISRVIDAVPSAHYCHEVFAAITQQQQQQRQQLKSCSLFI
jgi:hypothetical protein